jgi:sensor histidine kinase regulating citrate/malate metabolism
MTTAGNGSYDNHEVILDSIAEGVLTVNAEMIITSFNRSAQQITRVPREDAIGRKCFEVMRGEMCESECCIKQANSCQCHNQCSAR